MMATPIEEPTCWIMLSSVEPRATSGPVSARSAEVIVGIIVMLIWSLWFGLIIILLGLLAFGGFARGRWYCAGEACLAPYMRRFDDSRFRRGDACVAR